MPTHTTTARSRRNRRAHHTTTFSSSPSTTTTTPLPPLPHEGNIPDLHTLLRRFWKVATPYWSSRDQFHATLRLASVLALTLATTAITVAFNFLGRDFFNALATRDQEQFTKHLLYYLGAFAGGIPFFVLRDYAVESLSLRWRSWMTTYYMERYFKNQTFYKIQSNASLDNPDQRIVDDLNSFTTTALSFSLTLFNAAVDLISFSNILYRIYPPLFVVLLIYSTGGTAISVFLGKGLATLNLLQEKREADFRYGLVRIRENAESIAFYGGEESEMQILLHSFRSAFENLTQLLISSRNLQFFTKGYRYLIQILPAAVVAPMYFAGEIEIGVINQSISAFNHILDDISLIVYKFQAISAFSAVINRLGEFDDVLDRSSSSKLHSNMLEGILVTYKCSKRSSTSESNGLMNLHEKIETLLEIKNLTLKTPSGVPLIRDLSLLIKEKDHLLIIGPSGSGKTSLLRAVAGLWNTGTGKISYYKKDGEDSQQTICSDMNAPTLNSNTAHGACEMDGKSVNNNSEIFFLPQRPYMILGTLRQQLLYPTWARFSMPISDSAKSESMLPFFMKSPNYENKKEPRCPTSDELTKVLEDVHLGHLLVRFSLDSIHEWSSVLSLGEQQRLAFARILLSKPRLVLLDESTSALDEPNEFHLYQKIGAAGITYISVGHRQTLCGYHNRILRISTLTIDSTESNWCIVPIRCVSS